MRGGPGARDDGGMTESGTSTEQPEAPARRRLVRSRKPRVIGGVCEGVGRYFDIDPVVFRVVLAVLALTGGVGLVAYGLAWLLIVQEGEEESEVRRLLGGRVEGPALTAVVVALVGCGLFLSMLGSPGNQTFSLVLLASLAGAVYWSQQRRRAQEPAPPAAQPPPSPSAEPWWRETIREPYVWAPDDGPYEKEPRRPRRQAPWLAIATFFVALAAAAIGIAASWGGRPLGTSLEIGFGAALGVFGLGFAISTRRGRLGGGSVVAAVLVTALLVGAAAVPKSVGTQWSDATWRPASVAELQSSYKLGAGEGDLDLTALKLSHGQTISTRVELGTGLVKVVVPNNVTVRLRLRVGLGDVQLPSDYGQNIDVKPGLDRTTTLGPAYRATTVGTIKLDLKVGLGELRVVR
ncbi:MAG: rane protein [Streptomyces oryziradicis]|nr:rane protein [Actinacidiphila oryziradicis]